MSVVNCFFIMYVDIDNHVIICVYVTCLIEYNVLIFQVYYDLPKLNKRTKTLTTVFIVVTPATYTCTYSSCIYKS